MLHDIQLVGIVAALVLLDIVIFGSQLLADPHSVVETVVSIRVNILYYIHITVSLCCIYLYKNFYNVGDN